ncbi:MAG: thioredoxin-dependent thiol peroxidase [Candidatus Pacebacteria bacterium]|jgi:peroxiredoxin Q/BCP|nr:thioredoxin-dependent thiol peroxidase [Candidatus Paceibacterota bacterium]
MLKEKDQAPLDVIIINEKGQKISLKHFFGQKILLYFYPKDNTPGCTIEACNFRDANREISAKGIQIIGVSKDPQSSHQKFKNKFSLNFPLWSDPEQKLMKAFGVWGEKKMMGKAYFGTKRSTFLIDEKGKIIKVWPNVRAKQHSQEVLNYLEL